MVNMGKSLICGAHVITPGCDLGVTDIVVDGDRIAAVGASAPLDGVLVDEDLNPKMTIVNGEVKWHL